MSQTETLTLWDEVSLVNATGKSDTLLFSNEILEQRLEESKAPEQSEAKSGKKRDRSVSRAPREFTWGMGVQKWRWSMNIIANDNPMDRMLMGTTSKEEHEDISAYYAWRAHVNSLYTTPALSD